jgi:hypothetical protein
MTDQGTRSRDRATCPVHFSAGLNLDRPPEERSKSLGSAIIESSFADPELDCANCIEEVGLHCPLKSSVVTVELLGRIAEQTEAMTIISRLDKLLNSAKKQSRVPLDKVVGFILNKIGFTQHKDLIMDPSLAEPSEETHGQLLVDEEDTSQGLSFHGIQEVQRGLDPEVVKEIGY